MIQFHSISSTRMFSSSTNDFNLYSFTSQLRINHGGWDFQALNQPHPDLRQAAKAGTMVNMVCGLKFIV